MSNPNNTERSDIRRLRQRDTLSMPRVADRGVGGRAYSLHARRSGESEVSCGR